ncbi:hypothetical protein [Mesorhizobium sp. B2-1-2]|uniref:hypothetical protein n=1 Tax=Mesorhizobium sp. B2-1-2 TaxID=2589973 RepID=UPI00112928A4|nr:hypothetical protein [Mesorhizobium sp. B2-1-2]TPN11686.1 hypothetical protein FJ971_09770 [Mesorhizobium sp. B2-1-2]
MIEDILRRIDQRLAALDIKESRAAKLAGLSDSAIRDIRRAANRGRKDAGVSTRTLEKLAPVLETTVVWLVSGEGPETEPKNSIDRKLRLLRPDLSETLQDQFDVLIDQALEKQQRTNQ